MVVGTRLEQFSDQSFRRFHQFGNRLIARIISATFDAEVTDVLSGYRVFAREFAKTVPLTSKGFEIETELTLQALDKGFAIIEQPVEYGHRPEGSESKLNTFADGWLIVRVILSLVKDYRPMAFFGTIGLLFAVMSAIAGALPVRDYISTRFVEHVPSAILAVGFGVIAFILVGIGLTLDTVRRYQRENQVMFRKLLREIGAPSSSVDR